MRLCQYMVLSNYYLKTHTICWGYVLYAHNLKKRVSGTRLESTNLVQSRLSFLIVSLLFLFSKLITNNKYIVQTASNYVFILFKSFFEIVSTRWPPLHPHSTGFALRRCHCSCPRRRPLWTIDSRAAFLWTLENRWARTAAQIFRRRERLSLI